MNFAQPLYNPTWKCPPDTGGDAYRTLDHTMSQETFCEITVCGLQGCSVEQPFHSKLRLTDFHHPVAKFHHLGKATSSLERNHDN
ncbi:MAG TPA: hypothetical protein V6C95_12525 [Coleofasciculaceae cyanobacterium]